MKLNTSETKVNFMKRIVYTYSISIALAAFYTTSMYANILWPALFFARALFSSLFLVVISIIIEALLLHYFIKTISLIKALVMSCIGNTASVLIGTIVMVSAMPLWHLLWHLFFDKLLERTFNIYNNIASWILMYLGSCFIELAVLRLLFKYKTNQLMIPIVVGNAITYMLLVVYQFSNLVNF